MNTTTTHHDGRHELLAELRDTRTALVGTIRGLDEQQLAVRSTRSALCLGGLVKHVASVEESWMGFVLDGPAAMDFTLPARVTWEDFMNGTATRYPQWAIDHQADFEMLPGDTAASIVERYEAAAARTEEVIGSLADMAASHPLPDAPWYEPGARWSGYRVLAHLAAETAQHAGHAEIIRESIDGQRTM